jgi:hypothetical protein
MNSNGGSVRDNGYNPEVPFGVCDTPQTVTQLKARLAQDGIQVVNVEGENPTGNDCVFLAKMCGVRPNHQNRRVVQDPDVDNNSQDSRYVCTDWSWRNTCLLPREVAYTTTHHSDPANKIRLV